MPQRFRYATAVVVLATACMTGAAHAAKGVIVSNAWMRPTVERQPVAPVYFDITSHRSARIVQITSPDADSVVIVDSDATDDRRTRTNFMLEGGKTVRFAPRGTYVELRSVRRAVKNGDKVPLTLTLTDSKDRKSAVDVAVQVRGLAAPASAKR